MDPGVSCQGYISHLVSCGVLRECTPETHFQNIAYQIISLWKSMCQYLWMSSCMNLEYPPTSASYIVKNKASNSSMDAFCYSLYLYSLSLTDNLTPNSPGKNIGHCSFFLSTHFIGSLPSNSLTPCLLLGGVEILRERK